MANILSMGGKRPEDYREGLGNQIKEAKLIDGVSVVEQLKKVQTLQNVLNHTTVDQILSYIEFRDKIRSRHQETVDEHGEPELKSDEELIEDIAEFGIGDTEFYTPDISRLIEEKQFLEKLIGYVQMD